MSTRRAPGLGMCRRKMSRGQGCSAQPQSRGCIQAWWGLSGQEGIPGLACFSWEGASLMAFPLWGLGSCFRMKWDHITIYCTPLSNSMNCANSLYKLQLQQRWHCPKPLIFISGSWARTSSRAWCAEAVGVWTADRACHPSTITHHLQHLSVPCCPGSQPSSSWEQHFSHRVSAVCVETSGFQSLSSSAAIIIFYSGVKKAEALLSEFFSAIQHWILLFCVSSNNLLNTLLFLSELAVLGCNQVTSQSSFWQTEETELIKSLTKSAFPSPLII